VPASVAARSPLLHGLRAGADGHPATVKAKGKKVSDFGSLTPDSWTPAHLAGRIRAEQVALEARGVLGGERKTITALFADLKGFTALIEGLDPEEAGSVLHVMLFLVYLIQIPCIFKGLRNGVCPRALLGYHYLGESANALPLPLIAAFVTDLLWRVCKAFGHFPASLYEFVTRGQELSLVRLVDIADGALRRALNRLSVCELHMGQD